MLQATNRLLQNNDVAIDDINLYAVGLGPGNFTGLRTTLAATEAMALPAGTPLIGISSAAAIAAAAIKLQPADRTVVIGDARRDRLWCGIFDTTGDTPVRSGDFRLINIDELPAALQPGDLLASPDFSTVGSRVAGIIPPQTSILPQSIIPDAAVIARLALARQAAGIPGEPLKPIYMHPPVFVAPRFKR